MREALRKRLDGKTEEGFTLIELMVVVLIIAILLAIAIPSFLGARKSAQDRAQQSNLRSVLTAEKTYAVDHDGAYSSDTATLKTVEPNLQLGTTVAAKDGVVVAMSTGGATVCMTRKTDTGNVWAIWENNTSGTKFEKGNDLSGTNCTDTVPVDAAGSISSSSFPS